MSGFRKDSKSCKEKKPLPDGWIVLPSKTYPDRVYFYNTVTNCSTWDNPCKVKKDKKCSGSFEGLLGEKKLCKSKRKLSGTAYLNNEKSKTVLNTPDISNNIQIDSEIEDYDEQQDQYFDNESSNIYSSPLSNTIGSSSSPDLLTSSRINISDFEICPDSGVLEDNQEELKAHFASGFKNVSAKKSIFDDIGKPSTSKEIKAEKISESSKKKLPIKGLSNGNKCSNFINANENSKANAVSINKRKKAIMKIKEQYSQDFVSKIIKNIYYAKSDRTPAQTRLLKLRIQNAEKLKKLAANNPDFLIQNTKKIATEKKSKNSNNLNAQEQTECNNFSDVCFNKTEFSNNIGQETVNHLEVDFSEEMDWEPFNEESDVRNINTFREQSEKTKEFLINNFSEFNSDHFLMSPIKTYSWFLVLDTNIFVSCLRFVKELRDTKVPDLGYPVIYVPWRVLQELDHLKDSKIDAVNRCLYMNVRKAIAFLNENFKSRHPRVFGQSFEDFAKMVDIEAFAPDDEILQTCIQFQKQNTDKKLMLLTNDKNLESKAIVSGVEVYSKDRFLGKYLLQNTGFPTCSNALKISRNGSVKINSSLCEVQTILKDFLPLFVETEMKTAFGDDWTRLSFKKPPWTVEDALHCILKHWRSVFYLILKKESYVQAERLSKKLFKSVTVSTEDIIEIIKIVLQLVLSIKRSQKEKMQYTDLIPSTLAKLNDLLQLCSSNHDQSKSESPTSLLSSVSRNSSLSYQVLSQDRTCSSDVLKVKHLFKDIWDSLRSFSCLVSDVINSPDATNGFIIQEMKLKLSQILKEVEELVVTLEKIFALSLSDISSCHPLIIYFSNFLIRVYPAMAPDLINELPKCLAAFFADFEVRSLLSSFLKDFKDFTQDLSKAAEYFNIHFQC